MTTYRCLGNACLLSKKVVCAFHAPADRSTTVFAGGELMQPYRYEHDGHVIEMRRS